MSAPPSSPAPGSSLPAAPPSAQGVDARGVSALLDALEAHPRIDSHSLVLVRHGHVVARGWWAPYAPDQPHLLYSLSKSFTATALGLAVGEGLLSLDDRLLDVLPELADAAAGERARSWTLRHLLGMASGHLAETWDRAQAADPAEPLRGFLGIEPEREPGTVFAYNQPCTYAVAAAVQRATGSTLLEHLRARLLGPLGVTGTERFGWQQHPAGRDLGFTGLHATTDAVAALGVLLLQGGRWGGRQLLPDGWVEQASRAHLPTPHEPEVDWRQGYGFQLWRQRHGFRGDGAFGQFLLVLPEHDAVVAITSDTPDMQAVLDAVWEHLLPALGTDGAGADADEALARRLAALALPPAAGGPEPSEGPTWDGLVLTPSAVLRPGDAAVSEVRVERGARGWRLLVQEAGPGAPDGARGGAAVATGEQVGAGWSLEVPVAAGGWRLVDAPVPDRLGGGAVPLAVSGGWVRAAGGAESLAVEVRFLQTPHRLVLTGDAASASLRARWVTPPLRAGSLAELRSPAPATSSQAR
ncbi:serine hydrolase domain-containing protein [Quadrisphaera sp. KR29]|uniref:serine hydrolase domain-containing protein n=1 Tax=Quadrisphaera sp. KR29 TaxID=3461391 RepID=UPI0040448E53